MSLKAAGPFAAFAGKLTAYVCKRERIEGSYLLVDAILRNTGANRQATVTAMTALTSEVSRLVPQAARVTFSGSPCRK